MSLVTDCCSAPFSNNGCEARYGEHETRTCEKFQVSVFALQDGARTCPDQLFAEWAAPSAFSACRWCDGSIKMDSNGAFLPCWLPYTASSEGSCLAYDPEGVGWFDGGEFRRGGTERYLPKFDRGTQEFRTQMAYPKIATSHVEADKGAAVVGAACVLFVGGMAAKRRGKKKNNGEDNLEVGVAMQKV
ncbi:hypothetical protein TrRE_jg12053 [Triparma retinervis]|uniref:Uncharacterized protein n=1 Tax=Triparma retinervis TaxID=2557542 RepID=A0A9W7DK78_9STRA|nr:hypothetical protein TrRE_jg12053 [Triparma retinervis]